MTLSAEVTKHHTAWVQLADARARTVRYAVSGDRMVCFGDELPAGATNGSHVSVTVHDIAGGSAVAQLSGTVRDIAAGDVDANAVLDLIEHVSLGRTTDEIDAAIVSHRQRRLVALDT
jgi:hypothetical protein